ncbi:MAG: Bug family tripartite tricarboxylate transporter substrate binding protein [Xanthobacteraceae bacterium]
MTMVRDRFTARALICAALVVLPCAAGAQPQSFAGKTVTLTIGYGPGSGNDVYGRLIAKHIGRHIPGKPKVVPQNMPGAGSFKAANWLYAAAPKDGTVLGYISQTAATEELLGKPGIQFKTAQFNWVGRIGSYNNVTIFWHTSRIKTIADAMKMESTIGATGVGSAVYIYPNMMNKILGAKFKIVSGYQGTAQTSLAMERGEVEGVTMGWFPVKTTKQAWLKEKKVNFLVQFLANRHPDLPNVPAIVELARTPEEKQLFALFANDGEVGKTVFLPPGVPAATVTAMRRAFDAMMKDREFLADAGRIKLEIGAMTGEKLQEMIVRVSQTPKAVVARAKAVLR